MDEMRSMVRCKICGSCINTNTKYDYIYCACGNIAVDGGETYCRIIGNQDDWEIISVPKVKEN